MSRSLLLRSTAAWANSRLRKASISSARPLNSSLFNVTSSFVQGAARTWPVQFTISAVRTPVGVPSARKSLTERPLVIELPRKLLEFHTLWLQRICAQTTFLVFFVVGKVAFEPFHVRLALKGKDVRAETVKEETVVRDDNGAACEI
ncbi:hypothetical protein GQR58_000345 [Nymphon striatum]|nr:hypothetical protein GQR58_000345 [Nymphon striatum]